MKHFSILAFGAIAYLVFFGTFLYLIAFVGNLQNTTLTQWLPGLAALVPHSIDFGRDTSSFAPALAINLSLILLFGMQHSVMARMGFKAWLKRRLPESTERSVYVLLASLVLILMFWQWRPVPTLIWSGRLDRSAGRGLVGVRTRLRHRIALHLPDRPLRSVRA